MDTARIAELLEPFLNPSSGHPLGHPLDESQLHHISIYIDLLLRWNARINLTAIRQPEEIVTRHFGESFFLARHLFPVSPAHRVIDIGSGAGFPGLPLKIFATDLDMHLTLIESNQKKATFLREVARALTLTNIDVIAGRAEALTSPLSSHADLVTLRAVERFEAILPPAVAFLAPNARLALLIGEAQVPLLKTIPALDWQAPIPIPQSHSRVLSIGIKAKW